MGEKARVGDSVSVKFIGRLGNSTVVLSTEESGPFRFTIGDSTIFEKFGESIIGMKVGDKKKVELASQEAFGEVDEELFVKVPADQLPNNIKVGSVLSNRGDTQQEQEWLVSEVSESVVMLDGNHPLAGQSLFFEIELVGLNEAPGTSTIVH